MSLTRPEVLRLLADGKRVRAWSTHSEHWEFNQDFRSHWDRMVIFDQYTWSEITQPKMVDLGPEDIDLHRDLFRVGGQNECLTASAKNPTHVKIAGYNVAYDVLRKNWRRSIDGGKTWQACEKEES